ncbi:MAG: MerR family transcriptional regulator [Oscillospiraceae bacterium]
MDKHKAIPQGYMTIGEVAKKMGVTVRTLQYYDKEGLLSPTSESEGGRRLYTNKDIVKLHQILSLKHLGFSLGDIKNHLIGLDTPAEVAQALTEHATAIKEKMQALSTSLEEIETLKQEVLQMQSVNFKKYADIIVNLQMKNEFYWLIKNFDDETLDHIRNRFDMNSGQAMMKTFNNLQQKAIKLKKENILPGSAQGQAFAKEYWDMILEFTNGDMSLLPKLMEFEDLNTPDSKWENDQQEARLFIEPALETYFDNAGINPFEEGAK